MNTVEYSQTLSINYQSRKWGITLEVRDGFTAQQVCELAEAIVREKLGLGTNKAKQALLNRMLKKYFKDKTVRLADFKPKN